MKRLSQFVLAAESSNDETVKLQAMLQEMIKIKSFLNLMHLWKKALAIFTIIFY